MTTRHQLHMQLFTFNGFGIIPKLGLSDMAIWHDQSKQLTEFKQRESKTSIPETE